MNLSISSPLSAILAAVLASIVVLAIPVLFVAVTELRAQWEERSYRRNAALEPMAVQYEVAYAAIRSTGTEHLRGPIDMRPYAGRPAA